MSFVTEVLFSVDISRFVLFLSVPNSLSLFIRNVYLKVRKPSFSKASLSWSLEMVQVRLNGLLDRQGSFLCHDSCFSLIEAKKRGCRDSL